MNRGTPYKQHLSGRINKRTVSLVMWGGFLVGSVFPDFDHFISLVLNRPEWWAFLHQPVCVLFYIWLLFASLVGLWASLVLRRGN